MDKSGLWRSVVTHGQVTVQIALKRSGSRPGSLVILIAPLSLHRARSLAGRLQLLQVAPQHLLLAPVPGPNHPAAIPVDAALGWKES